MASLEKKSGGEKVDVFLNGRFVGNHENGPELVKKLRAERRNGKIVPETTIAFLPHFNEVRVFTDSGRVVRPLIIVENGKPLLGKEDLSKLKKGELTWKNLLSEGKMEFLDADEEEEALIALWPENVTPEHTHLEVDPVTILGLPASLVPFANYSRGDRVNYGASKGVKQALGIYTTNYLIRFDTYSNILHYPQKPIVRSRLTGIVGFDAHAAGQNFVVALMPWEGYNMEDAVVLNRGAIDRGLGRSTFYRPYVTQEQRHPSGQEDTIELPTKEIVGYRMDHLYRNLGPDGLVELESRLESDDVIIGRTSPPRFLGAVDIFRKGTEARRESSIVVRHGEAGWADLVLLTEDQEGHKMAKIRVRDDRTPELGDKFSSRHGQKGVVGMIVDQADMPYSENGIVPDMIANPHGIPSRMTVSQLMELLTGKGACVSGDYVDGTAFSENPVEGMKQVLLANGFRPDGKEVFYDGITGKKFEADIFVGVIYYHKLRHMVLNKLHARSRGPVQILTRQPTEGRSKKGGLRMGEMEKDCLVAHGAALLLKERFDSDKTVVPICTGCGIPAIYDKAKEKSHCPMCGETARIEFIEVSYAFHLLLHELMSLGVFPRLRLENKS
ncbi:MAG: DNA-directed RNA polymerase subunit B [archaeon]